jgi:hypothetical protein
MVDAATLTKINAAPINPDVHGRDRDQTESFLVRLDTIYIAVYPSIYRILKCLVLVLYTQVSHSALPADNYQPPFCNSPTSPKIPTDHRGANPAI